MTDKTSNNAFVPATPAQVALALAQADGALAAEERRIDPTDRAASDAAIAAAMRGEISFDDAVAAGLALVPADSPRAGSIDGDDLGDLEG